MNPLILPAQDIEGYTLLDSGNGRKLEQFGPHLVDRPEPQAMWPRRLPAAEWAKAAAVFTGSGEDDEGAGSRWQFNGPQPQPWEMSYNGVKFLARFTPFRHIGFFPDQAPHWDFMLQNLKAQIMAQSSRVATGSADSSSAGAPAPSRGPLPSSPQSGGDRDDSNTQHPTPRLLNLFGYTGVASLLAAHAGAHVTHVDASKKAIGFAKESQELAGLTDKPIRWIVDDALKFAERELRRGNKYDGILLDPPKYGRGPDGEKWEVFEHLPKLLPVCAQLLNPQGSFLILNAYAIRASFVTLHDLLAHTMAAHGLTGETTSGELVTPEASRPLRIPTAIFARWQA